MLCGIAEGVWPEPRERISVRSAYAEATGDNDPLALTFLDADALRYEDLCVPAPSDATTRRRLVRLRSSAHYPPITPYG